VVAEPGTVGPDPRRVRESRELVRELDLLRARGAAGTLRAKVSLDVLARLVRLPRSTLHRYVTGKTQMPSEVLDRIVIALGASPAEQREWNEAWFRAHRRTGMAATPWGLPPPVRGFTGRAGELAVLDGLVPARDDAVLAAVSGGPGVGKTALVVRWAHRVRFPDGCLYVDLGGYGPGRPLEPTEALATLLGSLGESLPTEPAARTARYRSLLAGRKMLVLLDNASCAEQVRPLLPGSGMVVVTSRDDLAGLAARDGAHRVGLDVLPLPDALALLEILGASAELAQRCGRLPLALRVAALNGAVPEAVNDDGLGWLETGDPRTDVRTVFSWSYRALVEREPEAAALFRALGRHRGVAFETADLKGVDRRLLTTLVRANLVEVSSDGRYRLPHLLGAYAAELSASTELRTA